VRPCGNGNSTGDTKRRKFRSSVLPGHKHAKAEGCHLLSLILPPDEVVSAILYGELAADLANKGWEVMSFAIEIVEMRRNYIPRLDAYRRLQ